MKRMPTIAECSSIRSVYDHVRTCIEDLSVHLATDRVVQGPPECMSYIFDADGKCTSFTGGAHVPASAHKSSHAAPQLRRRIHHTEVCAHCSAAQKDSYALKRLLCLVQDT